MATDLLEALLKLRDWGWNLGKSAGWLLTHQREMRGRGGRGRRGGWLPDQEGQNIFCKKLSCILFNIQVGPLGARVGRPAVLQARPILRQSGWWFAVGNVIGLLWRHIYLCRMFLTLPVPWTVWGYLQNRRFSIPTGQSKLDRHVGVAIPTELIGRWRQKLLLSLCFSSGSSSSAATLGFCWFFQSVHGKSQWRAG